MGSVATYDARVIERGCHETRVETSVSQFGGTGKEAVPHLEGGSNE